MISESIQPGLTMHQWFQRLRRPKWPGMWQSTRGRADQPTARGSSRPWPSQRLRRGGGDTARVSAAVPFI